MTLTKIDKAILRGLKIIDVKEGPDQLTLILEDPETKKVYKLSVWIEPEIELDPEIESSIYLETEVKEVG